MEAKGGVPRRPDLETMQQTDHSTNDVLLDVRNLQTYFKVGTKGIIFGIAAVRQVVRAVDGVSLSIRKGETLGLVGESGCGKSTLGYTILQLERATAGEVFYDGQDLLRLKGSQLRPFRRRMQIIFQDPHSALDARMTIGDAIAEPLRVHKIVPRDEVADRVEELLKTVGLNPYFKNRSPHEFSGGQQQRIVIARALSVEPEFMICDEPISALDVSIQAQIINLLESLQDQFKLTYLFISHDLRVVRHISDRVAVMYLGKIVEEADANELHSNPLHPYTQALLSSVPVANPAMARQRQRIILEGDVPSPIDPPSGCRFRTRCPIAVERCAQEEPAFREVQENHWVACHLA